MSHELTTYLSIFNQFKLNKLHNSLKLSFTNFQLLCILLSADLSLNQTLLKFLLCETNLDDPTDTGNFSERGYLPLIQKDFSTHIHGLSVYVKEELSFPWNLPLENSADSYLCFRLALLSSMSYFFFLY